MSPTPSGLRIFSCAFCGGSYEPVSSGHRYCTKDCFTAHCQERRQTVVCAHVRCRECPVVAAQVDRP